MNPRRPLHSLGPLWLTITLCTSGWTRVGSAAPLVPVGPEFLVNTYTTSDQSFPNVAVAPDGAFIIVWKSDGSFGSDQSQASIQARQFGSDGSPLGPEFQVNTDTYNEQRHQAVGLLPDGEFVVVWTNFGKPSRVVNDPSFSIEARRFASNGTPQGSEFQVNTTTQSIQALPSVAATPQGDFVVTWSSVYSAGNDPSSSVQLQRFGQDGTRLGGELQVNTFTRGYQGNSTMAMATNGSFVVVWESHPDGHPVTVHGQRFDSGANRLDSEFQVNADTLFDGGEPQVAADDAGNFVVVWVAYPSLRGQRFAADGTRRGSEFLAVAPFLSIRNPSVAADGEGNLLVVWEGDVGGPGPVHATAISAQQFDSAGIRVGNEFQIASSTEHRPGFPFVAANSRGDFVVSWIANYQDGDAGSIVARRFGPAPPTPTPTTPPTPTPSRTPTSTPTPLTLPGDGSAVQQITVTDRDRALELTFFVLGPPIPVGCQVSVEAQPPTGSASIYVMTTEPQVKTIEQPEAGVWTITARSDSGCPELAYYLIARTIPKVGVARLSLLVLALMGAALHRRKRPGAA